MSWINDPFNVYPDMLSYNVLSQIHSQNIIYLDNITLHDSFVEKKITWEMNDSRMVLYLIG